MDFLIASTVLRFRSINRQVTFPVQAMTAARDGNVCTA